MTPAVRPLEGRLLLSGDVPTGTWLGQDGHDYTNLSSTLGPDGVQDIHIAVSGLPATKAITYGKISGLGGTEWKYLGGYGSWAIAIVRPAGSTTADFYMDPGQVETGRPFEIFLQYGDGTSSDFWIAGGTADPNLRMPDAKVQAAWLGQDGHDGNGPGPSVGPDGIQDVHLALSHLTTGVGLQSVTVDAPGGPSWRSGTNLAGLNGAELLPSATDPTQADVYFNPPSYDLSGKALTVTVVYADGKVDSNTVVAGHTDPTLRVAAPPAPPVLRGGVAAAWSGQDGLNLVAPGDVHLAVSGLPAGRPVVAATLADPVGGSWMYKQDPSSPIYGEPYTAPLGFRRADASATTADVTFPPNRDETGSALTLRLVFDDGSMALVPVAGGAADVGLRSPMPAASTVVAHPGDDLNALASRYGTIRLSAGDYALTQPLILNTPVSILGDPGSRLVFSQPSGAAAWTAAIKIQAGHTTLDGFAVRFAGPVRWDWTVGYGPALIGTTDDHDPGNSDPRAGVVLSHLDMQTPPPASSWEEAPRMFRLVTAASGRVEGNILRGGSTELAGGPWSIVGNVYTGTVPGTFTYDVFGLNNTHDVTIRGNTAQPVGASGKTWRFLVMTRRGANDTIQDNNVSGVGPFDTDTVPDPNAAEIILTEAYSLRFEGKPLAVAGGGLILQIPAPQGGAARSGDVVAILSGDGAGTWRRIVGVIDPQTYVVDAPLPQGDFALSIASGFVNESYLGNTIDARGSSTAADLVLVGDHFGTRVIGNTLLGGNQSFKITAAPTESPVAWGWSHAPFLGGLIDSNVFRDAVNGGELSVEHNASTRSDKGRVYFTAVFSNNAIGWSDAFLATHPTPGGLTVGQPGSLDPAELVLGLSGNAVTASPGAPADRALHVNAALINGVVTVDQTGPLGRPAASFAPLAAPGGLALVNDNGLSPYDRLTNDAHLTFQPVAGAAGYEYQVAPDGPYVSIGAATTFLPAGVADGTDTVNVRAYDAGGGRGPAASLTFRLLTTPPPATPPTLGTTTGSPNVTAATMPRIDIASDPSYREVLYRDGVEIGRLIGPGSLRDPGLPGNGTYTYVVTRADMAGNVSMSAPLRVTVKATPPGPVTGLAVLGDGRVTFNPPEPGDVFEYRVGASSSYIPLGGATTFTPVVPGGSGTIFVHAIDMAGNVGPDASITYNGAATGPVSGPSPAPVSTPVATWLGQDGHDLVGAGPRRNAPDRIQDIHVRVDGLRTDQAVTTVDVYGLGGSHWTYNGPYGAWRAAWVQAAGAATADLYFQPDHLETGRPFTVHVTYADGSTVDIWVNGGPADPTLRMSGASHPQGPRRRSLPPRHAARVAAARHALGHLARPRLRGH